MNHNLKALLRISIFIPWMFSCGIGKNSTKNRNKDKSYIQYLSSVVNDTTYYDLPELTVVDSSIYPILDSVISWSENCKWFDERVRYLHTFTFLAFPESDTSRYLINAHLSPSAAFSLRLVKLNIIKQPNVGIFYHRHFLFVVPMGDYKKQKNLEYFPFVRESGKIFRIRAPEFIEEKPYASDLIINKMANKYIITNNQICGGEFSSGKRP